MKRFVFVLAVVAATLWAPLAAQDLEVELQRAVQKETVSGDLKAAIEDYRRIAARAGSRRPIAAQALVRMADAHRRLGDDEARRVYERIITEFADQKEIANEARLRLGSLASTPVASSGPSLRQVWRHALDVNGTVSDDGRYLSVTDWDTGDLAIRDLVAGVTRRLTNVSKDWASGDFADRPLVSPDGRSIVYGWFINATKTTELRLLPVAGENQNPRILSRGADGSFIAPGAWFPDNQRVIGFRALQADRTGAELVIVNTADGSVRALRNAGGQPRRMSISTDGRYVAYDIPGEPAAQRDIVILALDLSAEPVVLRHPGNESSAVWSRDGSRLLFLSDRTGANALWALPVKDGRTIGDPSFLSADAGSFLLGQNRLGGLYYAVTGNNRRNVMTVSVDEKARVTGAPTILNQRAVNGAVAGTWSPDGERVAYLWAPSAPTGEAARGLVIRSMRTGDERVITPAVTLSVAAMTSIQWFPDGKSLLVVGSEKQEVGFYRLNLDTTHAELLVKTVSRGVPGTNQPQLSPDGRIIYYVDGVTTEIRKLIRYEIATNQHTVLATGFIKSLALSADGRQLAYLGNEGTRPLETSHIAVLPSTGGAERVLVKEVFPGNLGVGSIGWHGDRVLFVRPGTTEGTNKVVSVPAAGGTPEDTGIINNGNIRVPRSSPDGKRLLYTAIKPAPSEIWLMENFLAPGR